MVNALSDVINIKEFFLLRWHEVPLFLFKTEEAAISFAEKHVEKNKIHYFNQSPEISWHGTIGASEYSLTGEVDATETFLITRISVNS